MGVQGESDAASLQQVREYASMLANVFSSFRQALPASSLMSIALVSADDCGTYQI